MRRSSGRRCTGLLTPNPAPQVVLGLNAGLGAYPEWHASVRAAAARNAALCFTDLCEEAALRGRALLQHAVGEARASAGAGPYAVSAVVPNPFRQPLLQRSAGHALPTFSNGFLLAALPER